MTECPYYTIGETKSSQAEDGECDIFDERI